jgi:hypothetical protein
MERSQRAGAWYLTAVGLALCLIAALFLWLMGRSYLRARDMTQWPQVPCLILRSEVAERRIAENVAPDYRFAVLYRYGFAGRDFESDRWSLRGSMPRSEASAVEELVQQYPVGSTQTCWVNPKQPEIALLKLDSRAAGYSLWFPGLFFLGGLGMMIGAWKKSSAS